MFVLALLLLVVRQEASPRFLLADKVAALGAEDESIVVTQNGPIQGVVGPTYRAFLGIPYAASPTGSRRWSPPVPHQPWKPQVLQATEYGAGCPQRCVLPPHTCPVRQSEDCLFINIYTPRVQAHQPLLPVMFFMPGGRFEQGDGGSSIYRAYFLANHTQTIVITVNYRLGALGFLVTDEFQGNFAIMDQRLALKWVRNNIQAFGGDPSQITMFGQSAGASSTVAHLISPNSAGLFSKAIIESNPITLPFKTVEQARALARLFVEDLNCTWNREDTDACLRSRTVEQVLAAQYSSQQRIPYLEPLQLFLPWTPVVDGVEIPAGPMEAFAAGAFHRVPIMIGTVSEEALFFIYEASPNPASEAEYIALLAYIFGYDFWAVLERYPPPAPITDTDMRPLVSRMGNDYIFACSTRLVVRNIAKAGVPVYLYQFSHVLSFDPWGPRYPFCQGHVCHGSELPFVFHSVKPYYNFTAGEAALSVMMSYYWANFAHSGSPNKPLPVSVEWPAYDAINDRNMQLTVPPYVNSHLLAPFCDFWDSMGYTFGV